ncbi:MAG: YqfO family protein [Motiliproteus sp.]|nr:YqfO family protein [Motiliproteus sp.]MCW9052416.1 YqfO family protein [Motiliproteus sp.]
MYKLCFYVPESHLEVVKTTLFSIGVGKIGNYDSCCWQVLGRGQFRPLEGSSPYLGQSGEVEAVAEYKVEMVCEDGLIKQAVEAMKQSHPYEEVAFDVFQMVDI